MDIPDCQITELRRKESRYCICIPVINEGTRLIRQLQRMVEAEIPNKTDIIICDGGSQDGSTDLGLLADMRVRALVVLTSPGIVGAQLRTGYAYALRQGYEGVITMDGNDKDDFDVVDRFVEKLDAGYDYVQGSRYMVGGKEVNTPPSRRFAIRWVHAPLLSLYSGFTYTDTTNGNRAYSRRLLLDNRIQPFRAVFFYYEFLVFVTGNAPRLGFRVTEVPMTRRYPKGRAPTKITIRGNARILWSLMLVLCGAYKPPSI